MGPLASLGLFAVLWLAYQGVNDKTTPFAAVLWYLWFANLALAIFNSLPAFPMDGGRILRSAVWSLTGSLRKATRFAARAGQIIGLLITAVGLVWVFNGQIMSGAWTALVGWFLFGAATGTRRGTRSHEGQS